MQALKETYADKQEMPESIKKMVKKYDVKTTEQLTKEMHKASTSIGQSRKLLHQLQDAKTKHRKSWLKHVTTLMSTLEKQYEAFETQQKDYQDRIQKSRCDTQASRRTSQRLNVQAAEAAIPEIVIEEDDTIEPPLQDAEEMELRGQENRMLQTCLKASNVKETADLQSEEEDNEMGEIEIPASKRPRSCEPGSGLGS